CLDYCRRAEHGTAKARNMEIARIRPAGNCRLHDKMIFRCRLYACAELRTRGCRQPLICSANLISSHATLRNGRQRGLHWNTDCLADAEEDIELQIADVPPRQIYIDGKGDIGVVAR